MTTSEFVGLAFQTEENRMKQELTVTLMFDLMIRRAIPRRAAAQRLNEIP